MWKNQLHDGIMSLRGEVWAHSLTLPLYQARKVSSHVFVFSSIDVDSVSTIFLLNFRNCSYGVVIFSFSFYYTMYNNLV